MVRTLKTMPIKFNTEIINAAIEGFESQKRRIDDQIAELRAMLDAAFGRGRWQGVRRAQGTRPGADRHRREGGQSRRQLRRGVRAGPGRPLADFAAPERDRSE